MTNVNAEITNHVESYLRQLKASGQKYHQAAATLKSSYFTSPMGAKTVGALKLDHPEIQFAVRPSFFAKAMVSVFTEDGLTPLELAQQLKLFYENANDVALGVHYGYGNLSATDVGRLLLDPTIYPQLTPQQMQEALTYAGFDQGQVQQAIGNLYQTKTSFTVQSVPKWQFSGVTVDANERVYIRYTGGTWTANPATGMVGPDGNSRYIAKPGYTLPGAREGALCGKVGNNVFLVGSGATVPAGFTGQLEFCINDDLRGQYGSGFTDNRGAVSVEITEQKQ